jgi:cytochrome P450
MRLLTPDSEPQPDGPITEAGRRYDPFDPAYLVDPYSVLIRLREEEPVFFAPAIGYWIVSRYETVKAVLRDARRFSARIASDSLKPLCPAARTIITESEFDAPPLLVNCDPPAHTKYRQFFSQGLQKPRLQALEPFVRETVDAHVERLACAEKPADLVRDFTWEVPALVLFELLGVPREDVPRVKRWAESRVKLTWGRPSDDEQVRLCAGAVDYYGYSVDLVRRKAEDPGDDYLSDLIRIRNGDDSKATLHEITTTAFNLLFAGHETTSSAASNLFAAVLARRSLWEAICRGEQPLDTVVEESLRFDPSVQAWRRVTLEDVELDGVPVPKGSRLLLVFAAANRDPAKFENPDSFDPARTDVEDHVTFGIGRHFCMGAPLARLELRIMLEGIAKRLPTMSLVPDQTLEYVPNISFRGPRSLRVTW